MNLKEKVFKNHMEIELRCGAECIVIVNDLFNSYDGEYMSDSFDYTDDLICDYDSSYDIMKVTNPFTKEVIFERDKVDWSKVEVDTKILVQKYDGAWVRRYFAEYKNGLIYAWENGKTSWSTKHISDWKHARLYKEGE